MTSRERTASRKYQIAVWAAFVVSALAIAGYIFMRTNTDHTSVGPPERITIAYSATTDAVLAEVAQVRGYYLQQGLDATPHLHPYGKLALQELLDGKADFATVAETPVMFAIMKGEKISVIATIQTSNKNTAIVARKDKGILTPADLKGRKIAATLGTTSQFFMDVFLALHGIAWKDVKVIDVKAEELQDVLLHGDVDAVSAFNPYLMRVRKRLGDRGITFYDEDAYTQTFNIVATQEFIGRNPGAVKKMLQALINAEKFVKQKPEEAQKIVADFSRMDIATVREIWSGVNFSVALNESLVLALEDESEWSIENKLAGKTQVPNYLDFIYFEGLESVKPEAVRILR